MNLSIQHFTALLPLLVTSATIVLVMLAIAWRRHHGLTYVLSGALDVAVAWGPLVGYFARHHPSPALETVPLEDAPSAAMTFEFSMGVSKGNRELKARLEEVIDKRAADIQRIFEDFGVPLLPLKPPRAVEQKPAPPGSHKHDSRKQ